MNQLSLLPDPGRTASEAGLSSRVPDGPARLLAVLVKRGLEEEHLHDVARLLLLWDRNAHLDDPELDMDWSRAA